MKKCFLNKKCCILSKICTFVKGLFGLSVFNSRSKFEIFRSVKDNQYYFRLKAGNNKIILSSENYLRKSGVENGIQSVILNAKDYDNFEIKTTFGGEKFVVLKSKNNKIIGDTETFETEQNAEKAIKVIQKAVQTAKIVYLD